MLLWPVPVERETTGFSQPVTDIKKTMKMKAETRGKMERRRRDRKKMKKKKASQLDEDVVMATSAQ